MRLTWLGQGGFLFESGTARITVDPYLTDWLGDKGFTRLFDPPVSIEELAPTLLVCTHDHGDHLDPEGIPKICALHPKAQLAGPGSVIAHARQLGVSQDRLQTVNAGESMTHQGIALAATPAQHTEDSIGLIIEGDDRRIYLSGDTEFSEDLPEQVATMAAGPIDLVLICINGRYDNMNAQDAARTVEQLHPRCAVPMHYGMFPENTADPEPFVRSVRKLGIRSTSLVVGEPLEVDELLRA